MKHEPKIGKNELLFGDLGMVMNATSMSKIPSAIGTNSFNGSIFESKKLGRDWFPNGGCSVLSFDSGGGGARGAITWRRK